MMLRRMDFQAIYFGISSDRVAGAESREAALIYRQIPSWIRSFAAVSVL